MKLAVFGALGVACDRQPSITSCTDDLRGVYTVDGRRWMLLDNRRSLEAYPLFDDSVASPAGFETAPRVIDLQRTPSGVTGNVRRRYMRGAEQCDAKIPVRVTSCADETIELVLADPVPPTAFAPCAWPRPAPSRRELWLRR